ncbi:MAG: VOC family protein [Planctomycetota bacterium]
MRLFRVADLDAAIRRLRAAGLAVGSVKAAADGARTVTTQDPKGHPLQLWAPARRK